MFLASNIDVPSGNGCNIGDSWFVRQFFIKRSICNGRITSIQYTKKIQIYKAVLFF